MIRFQFKTIADRLGKSIADIARETGVNRNTASALYHGTIDGIKFDTLEKLCSTYRLSIADLVQYERQTRVAKKTPVKLYKQQGDLAPITVWWPFIIANNLPPDYFDRSYGELSVYCKKESGEAYLDIEKMHSLAQSVYRRYSNPAHFEALWVEYLAAAKHLESLYRSIAARAVAGDISADFQKIAAAYHAFWKLSIFIDSFDAGYDSETIQKIAQKHLISPQDASMLATPGDPTFNTEKQIALLQLAKRFLRKKTVSLSDLSGDDAVAEYRLSFDWVNSNYAFPKHLSLQDVASEIRELRRHPESANRTLKRLLAGPHEHQHTIARVLASYGLKSNPLWFFQRLTYWREHRKKINLMGIQAIYHLLDEIERRTGIGGRYLKFILPDEIESALRGTLTQEALRRRYEKGMLVQVENQEGYRMYEGSEAASLREELEAMLSKDAHSHDDVLHGMVASQGYARGVARIVLGKEDFDTFQEGEILVTGMSRPDFLPLMKRAAGIVTNEGGLTSHAAIVSRELGKPCVIGTKRATTAIRSGDVVEVRAHHGTVRILERHPSS